MSENKMLIDAAHPEETRVVVLRGGRVEEFDYESAARKQLRGNIYLAKVTRVEPALQAAFIDYGGNRHGFLAFNEIHPDYYQIPVADRLALLEEEAAEAVEDDEIELEAVENSEDSDQSDGSRDDEDADDLMEEPVDLSTIIEDDDDDDDDGRSTVLSQAMPRDESVTEEPGERPTDELENRSGGVAEPTPATEDPESTRDDTDQQPIVAEDSADASEQAAKSTDTPQPDFDTDLSEQPGAIAKDVVGAADNENVADELDDSEETNGRHGRRTSARSSPGRRRRGGRSRRQRPRDSEVSADDDMDAVDQVGNEDALEELPSRPRRSRRSYKIQEVVKRRQVLLIQVVKEERGSKGAALTTYLSLAGRYTVLMPNTARGGGISRKITNPQDRKRLKAIAAELDVPDGMGLIIRTAGAARTKQEIKRDFEYLLRLWESVRELTLQSTAPALVYEEGDLIKRSIRDLYNKDVDQVLVAGQEAYRSAKSFMRMLMPSHAKNVMHYEEPDPLFTGHGIERQLNAMFSPYVHLPSGGYLVINQTEALVAVDVNSGRSTREFSIEETALNTNIEAAEEVARQLKLRDLAGLIVIDFIDMEERRNNHHVERRIRDALRADRARIQVGRISPFGLLEMSRQRLRTGVLEGSTSPCPHCQGTGIIRSVESVALAVLRGLEDAVMAGCQTSLIASTTAEVALYILNNKREFVIDMEKRLGMPIVIQASPKLAGANFSVEKGEALAAPVVKNVSSDAISVDWGFEGGKAETSENDSGEGEDGRPRRRRRRRGGRRPDERVAGEATETDDIEDDAASDDNSVEEVDAADGETDSGEEKTGRRRRRGRRGGRRNRSRNRDTDDTDTVSADDAQLDGDDGEEFAETSPTSDDQERRDVSSDANGQDAGHDDHPETPPALPMVADSDLLIPIEVTTPNDQPETASDEPVFQASLENEPINDGASKDTRDDDGPNVEHADSQRPRRSRGEPIASEPRIERITVSPYSESAESEAPPPTESDGTIEQSQTAQPTRRGWWQRKLLGEA